MPRRRQGSVVDTLDPTVWRVDIDKNKSILCYGGRIQLSVTHVPSGKQLQASATGNIARAAMKRFVGDTVSRFVQRLSS